MKSSGIPEPRRRGRLADIARVAMEVDTLEALVEQFTIRIDTASSRLMLDWGTFRWSTPVEAVGRVGR